MNIHIQTPNAVPVQCQGITQEEEGKEGKREGEGKNSPDIYTCLLNIGFAICGINVELLRDYIP